ncbi:hypothetical protein [Hazenella coriacea]|uniref:Superfamily IV 4 TMS phage holin n=1 Tax=Hazenella coriacea TaxID=1179467 RepID=A0A4R3L9D8_9BACL|nr:hypothetical protein [Hazenella coriacea]TCS96681.1 hypothetical protein EDD58_101317 [Hazenella coriacea]
MIGQHLVRFVVCFTVFVLIEKIIPRFSFGHLLDIAILSIAITLVGWLLEVFLGGTLNPFARGLIAITLTVLGLISTSIMVQEANITLLGIVTASLWVGVIDFFVPVKGRYLAK